MRTFGRVVGGLGLVLVLVGSVGAFALLPPPMLASAGSYVERQRQALRSHLPEMPAMQELIAGTSQTCAEPPAGIVADAECGAEEAQASPPRRSDQAALRFRAPPGEETALD